MKMIMLLRILMVVCLLSTGSSRASGEDMVDLLENNLLPSEIQASLRNPALMVKDFTGNLELKPVMEFGTTFSGKASFENGKLVEITFWTDDVYMPPEIGSNLFQKVNEAVEKKLGKGTLIDEIPNSEGGTESYNQAALWRRLDDVILVSLEKNPSRSGISLHRLAKTEWLSGMGADQQEFWNNKLIDLFSNVENSTVRSSQVSHIDGIKPKTKSTDGGESDLNHDKDVISGEPRNTKIVLVWFIIIAVAIVIWGYLIKRRI